MNPGWQPVCKWQAYVQRKWLNVQWGPLLSSLPEQAVLVHRLCTVGYRLLIPCKVISSQSSSDCINSLLKAAQKNPRMAQSFTEGTISPLERRQNDQRHLYWERSGSCEDASQEN